MQWYHKASPSRQIKGVIDGHQLEVVLCLYKTNRGQRTLTFYFCQFCMACRGIKVNLRQAQNVSFPLVSALQTVTHPQISHTHTHTSAGTKTHTQLLGLLQYVWVGEGRWGKLIFLLREIDVICSALHCLRTIRANSLFSADQAVCWECVRVCVVNVWVNSRPWALKKEIALLF